MATPGTSSPTIRPARGPIAGAKTAWPASPTIKQRLCFALALWNGKDPILKERLFGLTNSEGNHGEDVKEYYFYLDSTPTHSYMKYLYKYPQAAYPYADLVETNRRRNRNEMEYELLDTGVFKEDRYFDVFVEYAKAGPEDILVRITAVNRGPKRPTCISCRRCGSETTGRPGSPNRTEPPRSQASSRSRLHRHECGRGNASALCELLFLRRRGTAALHRKRNKPRAAVPRAKERGPLRQGRHQRIRGPWQSGRGESREAGHQGRGALPRSMSKPVRP